MGLEKSLRFFYSGGSVIVPHSLVPSDVSTRWCHQPVHVHEKGPLMVSFLFTAVDNILGYKTAPLNPSTQLQPSGAVCQITPTAKT